jgi:tetratricopeptide (TPR) repeat protein
MKTFQIHKYTGAACLAIAMAVGGGCARTPMQKRDRYIEAGKKLFEQKEYARAILEFRNAVAAMPKDAEGYYQLGRAYEANRDYQTAVNILQKALDLNPKHPGADLELSKILAATSDPENLQVAENRLMALLQGGYSDPEALNSLAFTEMKLGKIENAVSNLEQSLALSPTLNSAILLVQAKIAQRDFKGAEDVLQRACAEAPKSAEARAALGGFYILRGQPREAEAELQKALTLNPNLGSALLDLGKLQAGSGRKQDAEQTFKRLSSLPNPSMKAAHALFLLQEGRQEEAVREFEQLAKNDPDDRVARTRLVAVYWASGRKQEAEKTIQAALKKNPKDMDALLQRGELSLMSGRYDLAQRDLNQVLHDMPNSAEAHFILSRLHQAQRNALLQRQELIEALRFNPALLDVRLELARLLLRGNSAKSALEVIDEAPKFQRGMLPVLVERNWALWSLGDLAEMRKGIDAGLSIQRSSDLLLQDGVWKLRAGKFGAARESLEEALNINPGDVRALTALNQAYAAQKQGAAALEKVKEYASRNPKAAPVQEFLGVLLTAGGDRSGARRAFEAAKAADPTFVRAELSLTQLDIADGKLDDAQRRLKTILAASTGNVVARLWSANLEATKGDKKAAIEDYRQVIQADPNNAQALNNYAYLLSELNDQSGEALKYAQRAKELSPTHAAYSDTLGWILYQRGLYSMAVSELERAAGNGGDALCSYHLAMAYAKAGNLDRGRKVLQAGLKQNPSLPEAKTAREMLGIPQ